MPPGLGLHALKPGSCPGAGLERKQAAASAGSRECEPADSTALMSCWRVSWGFPGVPLCLLHSFPMLSQACTKPWRC